MKMVSNSGKSETLGVPTSVKTVSLESSEVSITLLLKVIVIGLPQKTLGLIKLLIKVKYQKVLLKKL